MFKPTFTNPPYIRNDDPKFLTRVLVESGYRLFQVEPLDENGEIIEGKSLRVWARSLDEVRRAYTHASIQRVNMDHNPVRPDDDIVLPVDDNSGG